VIVGWEAVAPDARGGGEPASDVHVAADTSGTAGPTRGRRDTFSVIEHSRPTNPVFQARPTDPARRLEPAESLQVEKFATLGAG
jgi:hypothetical protein